tara:strand:- start:275 stop:634 length:360 start_codon:yes stop_codon:yes gene_type:complete
MNILSKLLKTKKDEAYAFINDRRGTKRYDVQLNVAYSNPDIKIQGESLTKNICKTGIRIQVDSAIPKESLLHLKIEDPYSAKSISSKAKIVWVEKFVTGEESEDVTYEAGIELLKKKLF